MQDKIQNFRKLVDSLRKYQKAELIENSKNIIEELYTDPIEGDFVLQSLLS